MARRKAGSTGRPWAFMQASTSSKRATPGDETGGARLLLDRGIRLSPREEKIRLSGGAR